MVLKKSAALEKMRRGETAAAIKINLDGTRGVNQAGLFGFDFIWLDQEHCPNGISEIERQFNAAKAAGCDVIVRVKRGSYSDMINFLEMNCEAIMVPHVKTAAEAAEIARTTKFHPLGRRPIDGGNADGGFTLADYAEYRRFVNENRMVIIQIEDVEALDELDAIAATPGIDMLFFGPADFAHSLGAPDDFQHPRLLEARRLVAAAAGRHGKLAGTTGPTARFRDYAAMGYHLISVGADVVGLSEYYGRIAAEMAKIRSEK